MGFQFLHVESYSRKADKAGCSVDFVLAEASRRADACTHVEAPEPPQVLVGIDLDEVRALHDERVVAAGATDKAGKFRKARIDQHTLFTTVASHPGGTPEEVARWEYLTVAWLKAQHGDRLVSVIRHVDEAHPHLHAYVVPSDAAMRARDLHPGVVAKAAAKDEALAGGADDKSANAVGDKAYRSAMRAMQDSYWEAVGLPCGLARLGPGRRRVSRAEWKAEQAQAAHVGELVRAASEANVVLHDVAAQRAEAEAMAASAAEAVAALRIEVERAKVEADAMKAAADAEAARIIDAARRQSRGILSRAREEAVRLIAEARSVGSVIGSLIYGLVGQSPARVEARAAEAERQQAAIRESALRQQVEAIQRDNRGLRRDLVESRATVRQVAGDRDELRQAMASRLPKMGISRPLSPGV